MLLSRLQALFQEIFDDPRLIIQPDASPETVPDWDSVAQVKLILAVEEAFNVSLTTDEVAHLKTAGDFIRVLHAKGVSG